MTEYNKRYKMTLMSDGKRWRKTYKGERKYFPILAGETKASSYTRCLAEMEDWVRSIDDARRPALSPIEANALDEMRIVSEGTTYDPSGQPSDYVEVSLHPSLLLAQAINPAVKQNLLDRLPALATPQARPKKVTIRQEINRQTAIKYAQAEAGKLVYKTAKRFHEQLEYFVKALGDEHRPITVLDNDLVMDYYAYLLEEVRSGKRNNGGANSLFVGFKHFISYAYLTGNLPELPRVLAVKNRLLSFGKSDNTNIVDDNYVDDIAGLKTLLKKATGRVRLYILIALNCGYGQTDIATLRDDEVNWVEGRITRKRGKTKKGVYTPEVPYLLWRETFALLKEHRSGGEVVLLNEAGKPLVSSKAGSEWDNIAKLYWDFAHGNNLTPYRPFSSFRKTGASLILRNKQFDHNMSSLWLGHAPSTMAKQHYALEHYQALDRVVAYLGKQYGVK